MNRRNRLRSALAVACASWLACSPAVALADPPPWAPAHGWRSKHDNNDLFFLTPVSAGFGQCNRDVIGAVVGAVAGGAVGQTIGSGSGRVVATVTGVLLGGLLGGMIGESLDEADRACFGETLESAPDRSTVAWANPNAGTTFEVTPQATWQTASGQYCREYRTTASIGGESQSTWGTACRQPDGSWRLMD
jgi:surface antigen